MHVSGIVIPVCLSTGSRAGAVRVIIFSHSIVFWARKRAASSSFGMQLQLGSLATVHWVARRGMLWDQLLPAFYEFVHAHAQPHIVVIHLGENDLGQRTTLSLRLQAYSDILHINQHLAGRSSYGLTSCLTVFGVMPLMLKRLNWIGRR